MAVDVSTAVPELCEADIAALSPYDVPVKLIPLVYVSALVERCPASISVPPLLSMWLVVGNELTKTLAAYAEQPMHTLAGLRCVLEVAMKFPWSLPDTARLVRRHDRLVG